MQFLCLQTGILPAGEPQKQNLPFSGFPNVSEARDGRKDLPSHGRLMDHVKGSVVVVVKILVEEIFSSLAAWSGFHYRKYCLVALGE